MRAILCLVTSLCAIGCKGCFTVPVRIVVGPEGATVPVSIVGGLDPTPVRIVTDHEHGAVERADRFVDRNTFLTWVNAAGPKGLYAPEIDMPEAELIHVKLPNADLSNANLHRANLAFANLHHAELVAADLSGANLIGADLSDADLVSANMTGADLHLADLRNADLRYANLSNARLNDAKLAGANLNGVIGYKPSPAQASGRKPTAASKPTDADREAAKELGM